VQTEFISKAVLDEAKSRKNGDHSQAHGATLNSIDWLAINRRMKLPALHASPFVQLAAVRAKRNLRVVPLAGAEHLLYPATRQSLARLRAAELADWQNSGGDFLMRSHWANDL
jgi:hypothetical protein